MCKTTFARYSMLTDLLLFICQDPNCKNCDDDTETGCYDCVDGFELLDRQCVKYDVDNCVLITPDK